MLAQNLKEEDTRNDPKADLDKLSKKEAAKRKEK